MPNEPQLTDPRVREAEELLRALRSRRPPRHPRSHPRWTCLECGKAFRSTAASRVCIARIGRPRCGDVDIDLNV